MRRLQNILCAFGILLTGSLSAQIPAGKTAPDFSRVFAFALDANIPPALNLLNNADTAGLTDGRKKAIEKFQQRFGGAADQTPFNEGRISPLDDLVKIYHGYWRKSLLDPEHSYDSLLKYDLVVFFSKNRAAPITSEDTLQNVVVKYVEAAGYHTTGLGATGKLFDLLIWKTEKDTTYRFTVNGEKLQTRVVFMDDFVTLGWEEYATLGRAYPGGWATKEALFCVRSAYDLNSENFLISYLCHEGCHFADYKLFPKLSSTDLEYRAKLTELSLLDKDLFSIIDFFLQNANYDSDNDHSIADYCVMRDLSKYFFHTEMEKDLSKWKALPVDKIHKASAKLLKQNTRALKKKGKDVEKFIKP